MYRLIGADGQEYGPVAREQLRQWVAEGRANAQTQTQLAGETGWVALGARPEFADLLGGPAGHVPPAAPASQSSADEIRNRDYRLDVGEVVRRGWQILTTNAGLLIAGTLLVLFLNGIASAPSSIGNLLMELGAKKPPLLIAGIALLVVGWIASVVLAGPLLGGLYWPYIKLTRGQRIEFGDFFAGFRRGFVNLMLGNFLVGLLSTACLAPGALVLVAGIFLKLSQTSRLGVGLIVGGAILLAVGLAFTIYLVVCWVFTLALIVDRQMGFWEAMKLGRAAVRKHWWSVLWNLIVVAVIALSGVLACCVGLIFTLPLGFAIQMVIYENIFGARTTANP